MHLTLSNDGQLTRLPVNSRTLYVPHLHPREGHTHETHPSLQSMAQCPERQTQAHLKGRQHAAFCESDVRFEPVPAAPCFLTENNCRVDDIEDDSQLRRGNPGEY